MSTAPFELAEAFLLSSKATDLDDDSLDAHTRVAERLLKVTDVQFQDDLDAEVVIALTFQVNFQLEQGVEAAVYRETMDGEQRSIYREVEVDFRAKQMIARLVDANSTASLFSNVGSLR